MNIEIRKAETYDVDILNELFKSLIKYEKANYDNNIKDNLIIDSYFNKRIDKDIILVAAVNSKVIGYVYGILDLDNKIKDKLEASIDSIYVKEEYRYNGIGTKLIESIINEFRNKGVKYVPVYNNRIDHFDYRCL